MEKFLIRTGKILCLVLPILLIMLLVPFRSNNDLIRIRDYYREEKNSLDVVFLGASEVFAGISSALAYGEYGYTSYPYCLSSNYVDLFPVQLDEIYRTQDPKLVVVDISGAVRPDLPENADAIFRTYIEKLPLSVNKIRAIHAFGDREHLLSYYIPFMMYHGSTDVHGILSTVKDELYALRQGYSYLKGTTTCTLPTFTSNALSLSQEEMQRKSPLSERADAKLRELLEYCQSKGYDNILFTAFPHRIASEYACYRIQLFNAAADLIRSYGYDFINLENLSQDIGLVPDEDYYNDEHLNYNGQRKLTRYLSQILVDCYEVNNVYPPPPKKI